MGADSHPTPTAKGPLWIMALSLLTLAICSVVFVARLSFHGPDTVVIATNSNSTAEEAVAVIAERRAAFRERRLPAQRTEPTAQSMPGATVASITVEEPAVAPPPAVIEQTVFNGARAGAGNINASAAGADARSGAVIGQVFLHGTPPPETPIDLSGSAFCRDAQGGPLTTRYFVVGTSGGLANVLVYVRGEPVDSAFPPPATTNEIVFTNCQIEPYLSAVRVGQQLVVRNADATFHSFRVTSRLNSIPAVPLPDHSVSRPLSFSKTELFARANCVVHPWEIAYVSVLPHPFFAITDAEGRFAISNLPPGQYSIGAIHRERRRTNEVWRALSVAAGQTATINLVVDVRPQ